MPVRLNLRHLAFFRILAETANFTAAAERCGVSQPGLSAAIRQFEADLGLRLFHRDTRNVSLTADGEAILPLVEATLINSERAAHDIYDFVETKRTNLRIAAVSSITAYLLPAAISRFEPSNSRTKLDLLDVQNSVVTDYVYEGTADIGIGLGPFDTASFHQAFLFSDQLEVVVANHHRLAGRTDITWSEVGLEPIIAYHESSHVYQIIERTLAFHGIRFTPAGTYNFRQTIFGMALTGKVVTILPSLSLEMTLPPGLTRVALTDPVVSRQYFIVTRKGRALLADAAQLVNHLKTSLPLHWSH